MVYQGYLSLGEGDDADEVMNAARTDAYVENAAIALGLRGCEDCDSMEEALGDDTYVSPALDPAPWYDSSSPDTADFYGVYPLGISGIEDASRQVDRVEMVTDGGVTVGSRRTSKEIRVNALLVGRTEEGVDAGLSWLTNVLDRSCDDDPGCRGTDLNFLSSCPPLFPGEISNTPVNYTGTGNAAEEALWTFHDAGSFSTDGTTGGIMVDVTAPITDPVTNADWHVDGHNLTRPITGLVPGEVYQLRMEFTSYGQEVKVDIGDAETFYTSTAAVGDDRPRMVLDFVATATTMTLRLTPIDIVGGTGSFSFDLLTVRRIDAPAVIIDEPYVDFSPPTNNWSHPAVPGTPNNASVQWQHNQQTTSILVHVETDGSSTALYTPDMGPRRTMFGLTPGETYKVYVSANGVYDDDGSGVTNMDIDIDIEGAASWSVTFNQVVSDQIYQEIEFVALTSTAVLHIHTSGSGLVVRTNLIRDPQLTATVWPSNGSTGVNARSDVSGPRNRGYMERKLTTTNTGGRMGVSLTPTGTGAAPVVGGQQYTVSGWWQRNADVSAGTHFFAMAWYTAAGALISSVDGGATAVANDGVWHRISNTFTAPANAAFGRPAAIWNGSRTAGSTLRLANMLMERSATMGTYFDGSLLGRWTGPEDASTSTFYGGRANLAPNPTAHAGGAPWFALANVGTPANVTYVNVTERLPTVTTAAFTQLPAGTAAGANTVWLAHPSVNVEDFVGAVVGESISVAALFANTQAYTPQIRIAWFTGSSGGATSYTNGAAPVLYNGVDLQWYWGQVQTTVPAGATRFRIEVGWTSAAPVYPVGLYATAAIAEVGRGTVIPTTDWFDGDSYSAEWRSTPYNDASVQITTTGSIVLQPNGYANITVADLLLEHVVPTASDTPATGGPYERLLYDVQALAGPTIEERYPDRGDCDGFMMRVSFSFIAGQPYVYRSPVFAGGLPSGSATTFDDVECLFGEEVRFNYAINGSGEGPNDAAGYSVWDSAQGDLDFALGLDPVEGLYVVRWITDAAASGSRVLTMNTDITPVTGEAMFLGGVYVASGWIKTDLSGEYVLGSEVDGVGNATSSVVNLVAGEWTYVSIVFSLPTSGTVNMETITLQIDEAAAATVYMDGWMIEQGSTPGSYFDHTTSNASGSGDWTGDPFESTIQWTPADVDAPIQDPDCPTPPTPPAPPVIENTCVTIPDTWLRSVLVVDPSQIPGNTVAAPIIRVTAGADDISNARIRFWRTEPGQTIDDLSQCSFDGEMLVTYVPAGSTMIINGVTRIATIDGRPANHLLYATDGGPVQWPLLRCSNAYLVTLDVDPDAEPTTLMTLDLAVRDY